MSFVPKEVTGSLLINNTLLVVSSELRRDGLKMKQKLIPRSGEKKVIITLISFLKEKKQQRPSDDVSVCWE